MDMGVILSMLIGFGILLIVSLSVIKASLSLAPWVPTRRSDFERIDRLADLKAGQAFYEIGSGTARLTSFIAKKNPQAKVVGIELALPLYLFTKLRVLLLGPRNLSIRFGDALRQDYGQADVVYLYGIIDTVNGVIKEKLERELRSGSRFISYTFPIEDWQGISSLADKPSPGKVGISVCIK